MKLPKDPIYWPGEMNTWETCPTCNKDFTPHNRLQKYCDSSCRNKANYKKHKRINRGELIAWIENNCRAVAYNNKLEAVVFRSELLKFINQGEEQNE